METIPVNDPSPSSESAIPVQRPAGLDGYRMPAEWEPHEATWLSWPRREGNSFPGEGAYDRAMPALAKMVAALADSERVNINVCDEAHERDVRGILSRFNAPDGHVTFFHHLTDEPWCRDHGPLFVVNPDAADPVVILDWSYNAWGMKYLPFENDDYIPTLVAGKLGLPVRHPEMVLEGGSIDVNGAGALMTTRSCLLHPNRNPELSKEQIEQTLRDWLGVRQIIWLGDGIAGDDTDGHVDDLTRFVSENRIVTVVEENDDDENFEPLARNLETLRQTTLMGHTPLEVTTLPMPSAIFRDGQRLPASYANFYIANTVVLLPVFADTADRWACAVLENLFPGRTIVPIDCRELIWGLGAFHCLTQQQPLAPKR